MRRVQGKVAGRVQGVGFRYFVYHQAQNLGLSGYVRNEYDGTVSFEVQGEEARLQAFLHAVEKGPALARVAKIQVDDLQPVADEGSFEIRG